MSEPSGPVGGTSVHELLADVALRAPGTAAPGAALAVLDMLAQRGDFESALAIGRVTGSELGLDVNGLVPRSCPSFGSLAGLVEAGTAAGLPSVLAAGFLPWQFIDDLDRWEALHQASFSEDAWPAFLTLIARGGAARDHALRGYAMAAVAGMAGLKRAMGTPRDAGLITHLIGVAMGARVVDGGNADSSFRFGADLLLGLEPGGLRFRMTHELTHLETGWLDAGLAPGGRPRDIAADCGVLVTTLPGVLAAVFDRPPGPAGYELVPAPNGMRLGCSRDQLAGGTLLHVSMSTEGGPIQPAEAGALGWLTAELLGASTQPDPAAGAVAGTDVFALALSPRGVLHVGVTSAGVDPDSVRERAQRADQLIERAVTESRGWFQAAADAGLLCANEGDLPYLLGLETRPVLAAVSPETAGDDMDRHELVVRTAGLADRPAGELRELLRSMVRCGDPAAVKTLLAAGARPSGAASGKDDGKADDNGDDAGVGRLGESLGALWSGRAIAYLGASPGAMITVVEQLAGAGFDVSAAVLDAGETLLTDAAARDPRLTTALLRAGVRAGSRNSRGATALASVRSADEAEVLLSAGADPDIADVEGATAVHRAVQRDNHGLVRTLLAHGASADARTFAGETSLMFAWSPDAVAALCDAGAAVNAATTTGDTALMRAAHRGDEATVRALLAQGADLRQATARGLTALHYAAQAPLTRARGTLGALLAAGADVNEETDDGQTALGLAAVIASADAVDALITAGADVNAATAGGVTALMCASRLDLELARDFSYADRMARCMRRLIDAGAAVDAADDHGRTALHHAAAAFDAGIARVLLAAGADPNIADVEGRTPLDLARTQGHAAIIEDLLAHGAIERAGGNRNDD